MALDSTTRDASLSLLAHDASSTTAAAAATDGDHSAAAYSDAGVLVLDAEAPSEPPPAVTLTGIPGATFNLINCILGSGVIVLPYALSRCGLLLGVGVLVAVAALTSESCVLIVACGESVGHRSFHALCRVALGKSGEFFCSLLMMLLTLGALVSYLVIVGDTVPQVTTAIFGAPAHTNSTMLSHDVDGLGECVQFSLFCFRLCSSSSLLAW
jgi:hypothetical protein